MDDQIQRQIRRLTQRMGRVEPKAPGLYAQGTWTPTYFGSVTAGATTYTTQIGNYTRIGRVVVVQAHLVWTAATGTGFVRLGGLPFAAATGITVAFPLSSFNLTFANGSIQGILQGGNSFAQLYSPATNAAGTELAVEASATLFYTVAYFA